MLHQQAWLSHVIMGPRQSHDQQGPCLPFTHPDQPLPDFAGTVRRASAVSNVNVGLRSSPGQGGFDLLGWCGPGGWCGGNGGGGAGKRGRSSFTGSMPRIPSPARVTGRLREAVGRGVADGGRGGRTVAQAARESGLSWPVVHAAFVDYAGAVLSEEPGSVLDARSRSWHVSLVAAGVESGRKPKGWRSIHQLQAKERPEGGPGRPRQRRTGEQDPLGKREQVTGLSAHGRCRRKRAREERRGQCRAPWGEAQRVMPVWPRE